jgi:putative transcriptional regulator
MVYHYTDSGLDNIYLVNGYSRHKTAYGEGVAIEHTEALHTAIGRWLVSLPKPLNGAELRFLRLEMELTQRHLAGIINAKEQTLRLWEKYRTKAIPGSADRLVRALYLEYIGGDGRISRMLEHLAELDEIDRGVWASFQRTSNNRWKQKTVPALDEVAQA